MNPVQRLPSPAARRSIGAGVALALALLLFAAWQLPLAYPSASLAYKFGTSRVLLNAGKMLGVAATMLLILQPVLAMRLKVLDRIFSHNGLILWHRRSGVALLVAAVLHPLFVYASEDVTTLSPAWNQWPDILGAALLIMLTIFTAIAFRHRQLGFSHQLWRLGHRMGAGVALLALFVHVLAVNEAYRSGAPLAMALAGLAVALVALGWIGTRPLRRGVPYTVVSQTQAGNHAHELELAPVGDAALAHTPGQFAFLRFLDDGVSAEEHPFTIASAPEPGGHLHFTIRCAGDWTRDIGCVQPGCSVLVDGPYGLFSPLAWAEASQLVLVAGGVGVTPMLAMLRHLEQNGDTRPVTLLWANRTAKDIVHREELEAFHLPGLHVVHALTRSPDASELPGAHQGRPDKAFLAQHAPPYAPGVMAFVCGPQAMMQSVRANLTALGYPQSAVKTEEFRF